jgi:hypothetical protein
MTDEMILRLVNETSQLLGEVPWHQECHHLMPSYLALLQAARSNHPDEVYLNVAFPAADPTVKTDGINPVELRILFTQLRIVLESLQPERAAGVEPRGGMAGATGAEPPLQPPAGETEPDG